MIQKKKLVQFYLEQYEQAGKKRPKRSISTAEMQKRVQTLFRTLRSAKPGRVNVRLLEDYHRQLKNISVYAHRKNRADILKKLQEEVLPKLVSLDLGILLEEQKEGMDEIFLSWLQENHPGAICQETLFTLYPEYRQHMVQGQIFELVPTRPEMDSQGGTSDAPAFYSAHRTDQQRKNLSFPGTFEVGQKWCLSGTASSARTGSV